MSDSGRDAPGAWLARARRYERQLAALWIAGVAVAVLVVAVGPVRARILGGADSVVRWWDTRWESRLAEGERLVAAGRWDEAAAYLERLDRMHPARNVRHARDKERERLLVLLAQSYEALDRRARTIETYQRLVAFDPLHYRNHVALANAFDRLESRSTMALEARDAFAAALVIFPAHLPSTRGVIQYHLDRGEFAPVVAAFEAYLDAMLVQPVQVTLGDARVDVPVVVDGRARDYDIALGGTGTEISIATGGFAIALDDVTVEPGLVAGRAGGAPVRLDLSTARLADLEPAGDGRLQPLGPSATLVLAVPEAASPVGRVRVRLRLYKPVDRELWQAVAKSYENLLDAAGRDAAATRTMPLPSAEAADAIMERLIWAREGLLPGDDGLDN